MNEIKELGALLDPRSDEEIAKDYKHEVIFPASAFPVVWKEKISYKFWDKRNQSSSLSCMAQSGVKMLGIENGFKCLSAKPVYQSRSNKDTGGMYQKECLSALTKPLACLETQLQSQGLGEMAMNAPYDITPDMTASATAYKADNYVFVDYAMDTVMDTIAGLIEQGKGVQIMLYFTGAEYWKPVPEILNLALKKDDSRALRHGICIVDYTLYKNEKAFVIEDSAGNEYSLNGTGQRIITETFFKARCYGAGYMTKIPKQLFIKDLKLGMTDPDVKRLQQFLNTHGFPVATIGAGSAGNETTLFGRLTQHAVMLFQSANHLTTDGIVGNLTRKKINSIL